MSDAVNYGGFNSYDSSLPYDNPDVLVGADTLGANPAIKLNYSDVAFPTALTRQIGLTDKVIPVQSTTGYPAAPFLINIDAGTATQEVILVQASTSTSFTDCIRNFDGLGAFPHTVYAPVNHSLTGWDYAIMNHHVFDDSKDWHPQYLDKFRHESPDLHQLGTTIPYATPGNSAPGDAVAVGSSENAVPSDHIHGRETLQQILYNAPPAGTCVFVNTYRTDTFFWLQTSSSAVAAPNPFSGWNIEGNVIPFTDYVPLAPDTAIIEHHVWNYTLIFDPRLTTVKR